MRELTDDGDFEWSFMDAIEAKRKLVTRVIFLLYITRSERVPASSPPISSLLISLRALRASVKVPSTSAVV